jgi:mitogen-activated protein kinase kinase
LVSQGVGIRDEKILAWVTSCTVRGLKYLKDDLDIIHRRNFHATFHSNFVDVKPTNMLVNTDGPAKRDFEVSGKLDNSLAKTNIGCQSYLAPGRIFGENEKGSEISYSVRSDVWSLGISIMEVTGGYLYPPEIYPSAFAQLSAIIHEEPPQLPKAFFFDLTTICAIMACQTRDICRLVM